jgi:hypothetical protein
MKRIIQKILLVCAAMLITLSLAACAQVTQALDVIGNGSVDSFSAVLDASAGNVEADDANGGWSLAAPDGTARFIWSKDYSASPQYDLLLETAAQPFLAAGLDPDKLPGNITYTEDKLIIGTKLGEDILQYDGEITPIASYEQIAHLYRDTIGYHTALYHFGVGLGDGNMFEWAKDMVTNDKDIVFVLNPEPLIAAGVDPEALEGWAFAKVPVMVDGKATEVDKFLKPFDLK